MDKLLTDEQIVFQMNISKGVVDTFDDDIIEVCKTVACEQLAHCEPLIRAEVAQDIRREIEQYAGEASCDDSGDGKKYYMVDKRWWGYFWKQYGVK